MKLSVSILLLGLVSCELNQVNPEKTRLWFYDEASLSNEYPFVTQGSDWVFHYFYQSEDQENIADDEFSEEFYFTLSPDDTSFELNSLQLQELLHVYRAYCFCPFTSFSEITEGSLSGSRLDQKTWKISGDLTIETGEIDAISGDTVYIFDRHIRFNGKFKRSSIPTDN